MPIPDYLMKALVPNQLSVSEYSTLNLPKTSFFVDTEHMPLRSADESHVSKGMNDYAFSIGSDGNLIL